MGQELIGEETAKAFQEGAKAVGKGFDLLAKIGDSAVGRVTSQIAADALGVAADWVREQRVRNRHAVVDETRRIMEGRRKEPPASAEGVNLAIVKPLIDAAEDESRPELRSMWARLLAAALDPERAKRVRVEFIDVVKRMHPLDAGVLAKAVERGADIENNERNNLMSQFSVSQDELFVSLERLVELRCLEGTGESQAYYKILRLTPFGRELMRACRD